MIGLLAVDKHHLRNQLRPMRNCHLAVAWLLLLAPLAAVAAEPTAGQLEFFEKKIRPVLAKHCYECHSAESKRLQANLLLDTREGIRRGGDSGPAVKPHDLKESQLIGALRFDTFEMPPTGKLPDAVIADFEKWIEMGAPDPRDGTAAPAAQGIDLEAGRRYWAFQPLGQTTPPNVIDPSWAKSDLDRFVLARLEAAGLKPVGDADRATLVRRVYFDLIGLPPTPAQIEAFLQDDSADALATLVDQLLASPEFGQRWGRHWLDVARFAESSGGGRTLVFDNAWRYRDYVVKSFHDDKPFDRFIREQIAGDLLPHETPEQRSEQLTGTGFLVLGPTNYELQDKELLRMEVIDEQIDTMGRAFLGLTLGCARCHDHKFDPLPTKDYYALAGIFRSTKTLTPGNVSGYVEQDLPIDPEWQAKLDRHAAEVKVLNGKIAKAKKQEQQLAAQLTTPQTSPPLTKLPGVVVDDAAAKLTGSWQRSTSEKGFLGAGYIHDQNAGKGDKQVAFEAKLPQSGRYEVRLSYTSSSNRATEVPVTVKYAGGEKVVRVNQRQRPPIAGSFASLGEFEFQAGIAAAVIISNAGTASYVIADAVQFLPLEPVEEPTDLTPAEQAALAKRRAEEAKLKAELKTAKGAVARLEADLKQLQKQAPPAPPQVMSVHDEAETGDYYVCIRGNPRKFGDQVPRHFVSVLSAETATPEITEKESGRRELADWLANPAENPLPARVMANRIWHWLFGTGLVRTTDNFGTMGEQPSHPELLNYLAEQFVADGWSVKQSIRRIMLSHVYQLSSTPSAQGLKVDPENRLCWRMNRRRLDAESIRDAMLAASGTLVPTAGGATIRPGTRSELGYKFEGTRRSLYIPVFRNTLHDLFEVFDFADPNLVTGARNTSTLPTQALYLMNNPFVLEQSRAMAASLLERDDLDDSARLEIAYLRAIGRTPTEGERRLSLEYLDQLTADETSDAKDRLPAWSRICHGLLASLDFRYVK